MDPIEQFINSDLDSALIVLTMTDPSTIRPLVNSYDRGKKISKCLRYHVFNLPVNDKSREIIKSIGIRPETYFIDLANVNEPVFIADLLPKMKSHLDLTEESYQKVKSFIDPISLERDNDYEQRECWDIIWKFCQSQIPMRRNCLDHDVINPQDNDHDAPEECKGGCRMFYCNEFNDYLEDDVMDLEFSNWFVGHCDFCGKNIPIYDWAIRRPLPSGGWRGCYCSHECLERFTGRDHRPIFAELEKISSDHEDKP